MSRTPQYNVSALPLWVQKIINDLQDRVDDLERINEHLELEVEWLEEAVKAYSEVEG